MTFARKIYCFIEQYESEMTSTLSLAISLCLIRLYFKDQETGSENHGKLNRAEEKKLKEANRRISRALRLSKVAKLRGGGSYRITAKHIATIVARVTLNAAKDGSIHALSLLIACQISPNLGALIKRICLDDNTDALVNEIAKNLHQRRLSILMKLATNPEILKNFNNILLELGLIEQPLTRLHLFKLAAYSINTFEIPIVKGAILGVRGMGLMYLTSKIKQLIISELSQEIAKGAIFALVSWLSVSDGGTNCVDLTEIVKLKQGLVSRSTFREVKAFEGPVANNILNPTFNGEIIDFIEIDPVVERLTGSPLFKNPLIHYSPRFNIDYVIERLILGDDITKLPRDHITNLW